MSVEQNLKQRITGRVKWFNNKAGFGFVTAVEGDLKDKDVFVHYSSINVPDDQYKYLVQGEYVDFELTSSDKSEHEFHAVNISGVKGGNLMCETRRSNLDTRPYKPRVYKTPDDRGASVEVAASSGESSAPRKKFSSPRNGASSAKTRGASVSKDEEGYTKIPVRRTKPTK
jgi:CspA family cold shock protein